MHIDSGSLKVGWDSDPTSFKWIHIRIHTRLVRLKKWGEAKVNSICNILPSIGNQCKDKILCDVLGTDVCLLLLGSPWQYNLQPLYKGRENIYECLWTGWKIVLLPCKIWLLTSKFQEDMWNRSSKIQVIFRIETHQT